MKNSKILRICIAGSLAYSLCVHASPVVDQCTDSQQSQSESSSSSKNCPDQTGSSTQAQTVDFVGGLNDRISQQRTGFGINRNRTTSALAPQGGAASADSDIADSGRLSPFVVLDSSESDRRATNAGLAYEQDSNSLILGIDYRLSRDFIAGATLSYLSSETDLDNNQGGTDNDTYILGFHASKYWGDTYFDALVTYGQLDLDVERIVGATTFDGSTDGNFHSAELAAGRLFNHKQWSITPSLRLLHVRGDIDGYTETTTGFGPLTYEDQKFDSLNARAALQADYVVLTDWGVLVPSFYLAYHHEHLGADKVVTNTGGPFPFIFEQIGDDPAKNYKVARINLAAQFKRGLSGFLSYERLADHEFLDRDAVALGFRYEL